MPTQLEAFAAKLEHRIGTLRGTWTPLLLAIALAPFANGVYTVPVAAWLFPVFLLRFVRLQRRAIGFPMAYLLLTGAFAVQFRGTAPIPGVGYLVFLLAGGAASLVSYVLDRLISRRYVGWQVTPALVFLGGGLRLAMFPPSAPAVRVASLSADEPFGIAGNHRPLSSDDYWRWAAAVDDDLFRRTEREMRAGAKIVF